MAITSKEPESFEWNVDLEVQLFYAMRGHKPVGVNRHFQMACIIEKFRSAIQREVTSQYVWDHLESMYDMAALHESEIIPFPNDEVDFALPEHMLGADSGKKEEEKGSSKSKDEKEASSSASTTPAASKHGRGGKEWRMENESESPAAAATSPKRKRGRSQVDPSSKAQSPASTPHPPAKRRRT